MLMPTIAESETRDRALLSHKTDFECCQNVRELTAARSVTIQSLTIDFHGKLD